MKSFGHAFVGVWTLMATQHNAWVHLAATVAVVVCGWVAGLSAMEWCAMVLAAVMVWMAEAFNTALEFLADASHPEWHPLVKKAKDVAAAGMLIAAVGAVVIGAMVFGGRICR